MKETGLVLKELKYKNGKEYNIPIIDFSLIKKLKIKRSIFNSEIEVEFA